MYTFREFLKDVIRDEEYLNSIALDDGATNWYVHSLYDWMVYENNCEEADKELDSEVYVSTAGVHFYDNEGYMKSLASYRILKGEWNSDTGEFEGEQ